MFEIIKIYGKFREPIQNSQCIDLGEFNLVKRMT